MLSDFSLPIIIDYDSNERVWKKSDYLVTNLYLTIKTKILKTN